MRRTSAAWRRADSYSTSTSAAPLTRAVCRENIMAIEELVAFIPPPRDPIENEGDWSIAEAEFGIVFPTDFKAMIHRYGTGQFYDDLHVSNPVG